MPRGTSHALMRMRAQLRREGGTRVCGICTGTIDMELPSGHPLAFELDHIQPKKFGGRDDASNLRCVHKTCNRRRGAGGPVTALTTAGDRSASW